MKNILKSGTGILLMSAFVFVPAISRAQLSAGVAGNAYSVLNTNLEANTDVDASVGIVGAATNTDVNIDGSVKVQYEDDTETKTEDDEAYAVLRFNALGIAITSSAQVESEADLDVFSENVSVKEKNVSKVEIKSEANGESEIEVVYRHKGRLFGFIPVTVRSTTLVSANVNGEMEVKSRKSWYAFLVVGEKHDGSELETRIKNNTTVKADAKVNTSAEAKARIVEAVIVELEAQANAQVSVNG